MSVKVNGVLSLQDLSVESYANANRLGNGPDLEFLAVDVIKDQWDNLKKNAPQGPLDIPKIMGKIEKEYRHSQVDIFFYCLQRRLQADFEQVRIFQRNGLFITPSELVELQNRLQAIEENVALELIWNQRIRSHFQFNGVWPVGHKEIRAWLNNPANQEMINGIQELNLSDLGLKVLPKEISRFLGLTRLELQRNQLSSLPESFGVLTRLIYLFLNENHLTSLPKSFGALTGLTGLHLNDNRLTSLPESFGALTRLTRLYLDNNRLTSLPESFGVLTRLTYLFLTGNRLTNFPKSFGALTALTDLWLNNNHLTSLPKSFEALTGLTTLELAQNYLRSLPESFTSLRTFSLNDNHLTSLPESFWALTGVITLSLKNNHLTSLPESFGAFTSLTRLDLNYNRLTKLPESFEVLTSLTRLDLRHNRLTRLPESFGARGLGQFLLEDNRLTSLPNSFRALADSSWLHLRGNPLLFISDAELDKHPTLFPGDLLEYTPSCLKYGCTTTPALFLQVILSQALCDDLSDSEKALLKEIFTSFPDTIKNSVKSVVRQLTERELEASSSSSGSSSSAARGFDLFADLGLLGGVARNVFLAPVLEEQQKAAIHLEVSRLAGQGDDVEWGAEHASDHILRYIDAWATVLYPHLINDLSDDMQPLLMRLRGESAELPGDLHDLDDGTSVEMLDMLMIMMGGLAQLPAGDFNDLSDGIIPVNAASAQSLSEGEEGKEKEESSIDLRGPGALPHLSNEIRIDKYAEAHRYAQTHQELLDTSLELMWAQIQRTHYFGRHDVLPVGAEAIRQWLNDPANAESITLLELMGLRLKVLPPEIGKLTQLRWINLNDNQLATLPPEIANLTRLQELYLGGNPLMFMLNKDLSAMDASLNHGDVLAKHSACSNYLCQSSLAALCQAIHRGVDDEALREHFESLSPEMQQQIHGKWAATPSSSSSSSQQPVGDLFDNRALFARTIIEMLREQFNGLSQEEKDLADRQYRRAGTEDSIIRLIDAMVFIRSRRVLPPTVPTRRHAENRS